MSSKKKKGKNERQVSKKHIEKKIVEVRHPYVSNKRPSAMEPTLECDLQRSIYSLLSRTSTSALNNTLYVTRMKRLTSEKREVTFPKSLSFIAQTVTPVD